MQLLGLTAIYQRPNTSKSAAAHKIYPYLLGGIAIEQVNQVWCSDVTYIPMAKGITVNAGCIDGIDGPSLKPSRFFEGRHWEEAQRNAECGRLKPGPCLWPSRVRAMGRSCLV